MFTRRAHLSDDRQTLRLGRDCALITSLPQFAWGVNTLRMDIVMNYVLERMFYMPKVQTDPVRGVLVHSAVCWAQNPADIDRTAVEQMVKHII